MPSPKTTFYAFYNNLNSTEVSVIILHMKRESYLYTNLPNKRRIISYELYYFFCHNVVVSFFFEVFQTLKTNVRVLRIIL